MQLIVGGQLIKQIIAHHLPLLGQDGLKPADEGFVVVGAGIGSTVFGVIVGEIVACGTGVAAVKRKL